jgi:hypothetical protein
VGVALIILAPPKLLDLVRAVQQQLPPRFGWYDWHD